MSGGRATYARAGKAGRQLLSKAATATPPLTNTEWRVLNAIVSLLPLYSKLEDTTSLSQIAQLAAIPGTERTQLRKVSQALRTLVERERDLGITYTPGRGRGVKSRIAIADGSEKDGPSKASFWRENTPDLEQKHARSENENMPSAPPGNDHTEKVVREVIPSPDEERGKEGRRQHPNTETDTLTNLVATLTKDLLDIVERKNWAHAATAIEKEMADYSTTQIRKAIEIMAGYPEPPETVAVLGSTLKTMDLKERRPAAVGARWNNEPEVPDLPNIDDPEVRKKMGFRE